MKKLFVVAFALLLSAPCALAQKTTVTNINRERVYKTQERSAKVWYQGELNAGYGMGGTLKMDGESMDAEYGRPFIETIHGVRITQYAFAGVGVGVQYAGDWEVGMVPVFLDLKGYYPVNDHFAPYVAIDLGFSFGGSEDYAEIDDNEWMDLKGGFYASYGIGLNYRRLNFGLGWQHQGMKFKYEGVSSDGFSVNSFFVKIGLKF